MSLESAIQLFPTISLDEMNQVKLMNRIETKFLIAKKELPTIFKEIYKDYRILEINGSVVPEYKTIYFDTQDFFFFNEHHRKRKDRYKVRFRNYISSHLTFLEIKRKKNGRVDKNRVEVENEQYEILEKHQDQFKDTKLDSLHLEKKLLNSYNRITLVSKTSIERVTFDLNVRFSNWQVQSALDELVIIELKQENLSRISAVYLALKKANVKPFSISKYCIGILKTYGLSNIKYNRFKKKLLKIQKITSI